MSSSAKSLIIEAADAAAGQMLAIDAGMPLPGIAEGICGVRTKALMAAAAVGGDLVRVAVALRDLSDALSRLSLYLDQCSGSAPIGSEGKTVIQAELAYARSIFTSELSRQVEMSNRMKNLTIKLEEELFLYCE